MKVFLITLFLVELTTSELPALNLGQILQSPRQTLELYSAYKADEHLTFGASENRLRFSVFKENVRLVSALNSDPGETAEYGLNLFSSMTDSEKKQWLGLNGTDLIPNPPASKDLLSSLNSPKRLDWVEKGAVTEVGNQGGCGSCWAWAAVGEMETMYKVKSGRLRSFSVQEYLDCVKGYMKDGCEGGTFTHAMIYSKRHGRLAATEDYPYTAKHETCKGASTPNAAVAYKVVGYRSISRDEQSNIEAISQGALAMAIRVTNKFHQYKNGIFKETDCSETDLANHAVTGVGYTENYFVIKNSWGRNWGKGGFMRLARNYHNCGLWRRSQYPYLRSTGERDRGKDCKKARYDWGEDDGEVDFGEEADGEEDDGEVDDGEVDDDSNNSSDEICKDKHEHCLPGMCKYERFAEDYCRQTCGICGDCLDKHDYCYNDFCEFKEFSRKYCKSTCGMCEDEEEEREEEDEEEEGCGNGLKMCSDGICRHEHMC